MGAALISFDAALAELDSFDAVIDARSPLEYENDHLPGALNFPVLNDYERKQIGTLYKQVGAFEAKKAGAALVARNIAAHLDGYFSAQPRNWRPLIYCWRGGNRSGAMTHVLAKIGWPAQQLDGGYRSYRQHVHQQLMTLPQEFDYRVLCGVTGSGKSRLLRALAASGAQVLDLEMLAAHRGSVLGHLPGETQPSQKTFESRLWNGLRKFDRAKPVFIESESKKVGNLRLPETLIERMRAAPCIAIDIRQHDRIKLLMDEYAHFINQPALLNTQLDCLTHLHGKENIAKWQAMASAGEIESLVGALLANHYDPAYLRSIARNFLQFQNARKIVLEDISDATFERVAAQVGTIV